MSVPLMPKATAIWLIENTALSFEQIGLFCNLHILEVQGLADGDVGIGMIGQDPVVGGQLTWDEIHRCEKDPAAILSLAPNLALETLSPKLKSKYVALSKRADRPDAIAWLLKYYSALSDLQICRLLGTTKSTIAAVRDRTHWNAANIKPQSPITLGLCTQNDLDVALAKAEKANAPKPPKAPKVKKAKKKKVKVKKPAKPKVKKPAKVKAKKVAKKKTAKVKKPVKAVKAKKPAKAKKTAKKKPGTKKAE